jgi:uncharacterized RDD family membrane protein YckC
MGQVTELAHSILDKDLELDRRNDNSPTPPWGQPQIPVEAIRPSLRIPPPQVTAPLPQTKGRIPSFSEIATVVQGRPGPPNSVVPPAPRPMPPSPAAYNAQAVARPPTAPNPYAPPRTPTLAFGIPSAGGRARSAPPPPASRAAPPAPMRRDTPPPEPPPVAARPPPPSPLAAARPAPVTTRAVVAAPQDHGAPMPDVTQPMAPAFVPDSFAPSPEDLLSPPTAERAAPAPSPKPRPQHDLSDLRPLPPMPEAQIPATLPPFLADAEPGATGPVPVEAPAPAPAAAAAPGIHEIHARPAPLWRRTIAAIVDASILGAVIALFFFAAAAAVGLKAPAPRLTGVDAVLARVMSWQPLLVPGALLAALLAVVYATAFGMLGRTPGRLLTGLRLVDKSGLAPAPGRAALRAVLSILSFAFFLCGFWLALFDRRGQTLHDKLSSTFVVRPV